MSDIKGVVDMSEIIAITAERMNMDEKRLDEIIDTFISVKNELILDHGHIRVHGEGTYRIKYLAADSGETPNRVPWSYDDGDRFKIEFNPAQKLKDLAVEKLGKILID